MVHQCTVVVASLSRPFGWLGYVMYAELVSIVRYLAQFSSVQFNTSQRDS